MATSTGNGTVLAVNITSTMTTIAQVSKIGGPKLERDSIEKHDLSSTAKEFIAGLLDAGEVTFTIRYDPALPTHATLYALTVSGATEAWQITLPPALSDAEIPFNAFVTGFELTGMESDELVEAELTLKVTGAPTVTVPA